jgi:hypothetical protein
MTILGKIGSAQFWSVLYMGVVSLAIWPALFLLLANVLGGINGCPEGVQYSSEVCKGGDFIYGLSAIAWLMVITVPVGVLLLGILIFLNVAWFVFTKKRAVVLAFLANHLRRKFFGK